RSRRRANRMSWKRVCMAGYLYVPQLPLAPAENQETQRGGYELGYANCPGDSIEPQMRPVGQEVSERYLYQPGAKQGNEGRRKRVSGPVEGRQEYHSEGTGQAAVADGA